MVTFEPRQKSSTMPHGATWYLNNVKGLFYSDKSKVFECYTYAYNIIKDIIFFCIGYIKQSFDSSYCVITCFTHTVRIKENIDTVIGKFFCDYQNIAYILPVNQIKLIIVIQPFIEFLIQYQAIIKDLDTESVF